MPNVEIKARYRDLDRGRRIARELTAKELGRDHQVDTYFRTRAGRLKIRESRLSGGQLIPYLRPDEPGPKTAEYVVIPLENPVLTKKILAGVLGIEAVVLKAREIFLVGNVRVHLDSVERLGTFLEFEAVCGGIDPAVVEEERSRVSLLMERFGVTESDLVSGSYREMVIAAESACAP